MRPTLTQEAKNHILSGNWLGKSPFKTKNGKTYLRVDSFTVTAKSIIFKWHTIPIYEFLHNADFDYGDTLTLEGITSKMEFHYE